MLHYNYHGWQLFDEVRCGEVGLQGSDETMFVRGVGISIQFMKPVTYSKDFDAAVMRLPVSCDPFPTLWERLPANIIFGSVFSVSVIKIPWNLNEVPRDDYCEYLASMRYELSEFRLC